MDNDVDDLIQNLEIEKSMSDKEKSMTPSQLSCSQSKAMSKANSIAMNDLLNNPSNIIWLNKLKDLTYQTSDLLNIKDSIIADKQKPNALNSANAATSINEAKIPSTISNQPTNHISNNQRALSILKILDYKDSSESSYSKQDGIASNNIKSMSDAKSNQSNKSCDQR